MLVMVPDVVSASEGRWSRTGWAPLNQGCLMGGSKTALGTETRRRGHLTRALGHEHVTSQGKGRPVGRIEVQMQDSSGDTCLNALGAGRHARASHDGHESGGWAARCNLDSRYARRASLLM